MDKKYTFNSKVNVQPSKATYVFLIILNICLALTMVIGIIKIIIEGFSWETIASMALAFVVVTAFKNRPGSKEHYEAAIATISFCGDTLEILYSVNGVHYKKYTCDSSTIKSIEYSDQLICAHITGLVKCYINGKEETVENLYIYFDQDTSKVFLLDIAQFSGIRITYMDR